MELENLAMRAVLPRIIAAALLGDRHGAETIIFDETELLRTCQAIGVDDAEVQFVGKCITGLMREALNQNREFVDHLQGAQEQAAEIGQLIANGDEKLMQSDAAGALTEFERALELAPNHFVLLHRRGVALRKLGRHDEALTSFDRALQPDTDGSTQIYVGALIACRSDCLRDMGRLQDALIDAEVAIRLCPDLAEGKIARARALLAIGRGNEALDAYDAALDQSADEPISDELTAERERAAALVLSSDLAPAPELQH
jgi:tetratricopeptide (TPR) repeat protein